VATKRGAQNGAPQELRVVAPLSYGRISFQRSVAAASPASTLLPLSLPPVVRRRGFQPALPVLFPLYTSAGLDKGEGGQRNRARLYATVPLGLPFLGNRAP